jgi:hypothetical protein
MASPSATISATVIRRLPSLAARDAIQDLCPRAADDWLKFAIHERTQEFCWRWIDVEKHAVLAQKREAHRCWQGGGGVVNDIEAPAEL